jgi:hypothetical protein
MAPPVQRIFPRLGTSALTFALKPTAALGGWNQSNTVFARGPGARYVGPEEGAAQLTATPLFAAIPNGATHAILLGQFLGDLLKEQTIPAGTWRVSFAARLANAGATFKWQGAAALIVVNGTTGGRRATIFDTTAIGTGARTGAGELTCLEDVSGAAANVRVGDYLALELGMAVENTAAALAPQASLFCDGVVPISSDGVAATNALSVLEAPAELALSLPMAGEQPRPSVTHAQAVALLKEHWPPHSEVLYAWDEDDAHVKKYFDWLGDITKLYGHDQVDRIFRELSPLTCVEQLDAWEDLLGIAQTRAAQRGRTVAERRRVLLARLRELGPLTVHNLAAIFYILANYAPGTRPDVFELDRLDVDFLHAYSDTLPAPAAIPDGTDFNLTNLQRDTPVLLDGGAVSDAGVTVTLGLSSSATSGLRVQLMGPDFATATWGDDAYPLPDGLTSTLKLRAGAGSPSSHVGRAIHGSWRLFVYKVAGSPAINLTSWQLLVQGKGHGGRGQGRLHWSVHLDSTHQRVDRRDVESTLDRITQSYARGFCVYSTRARPGEQINGIGVHRAGRFLPGA